MFPSVLILVYLLSITSAIQVRYLNENRTEAYLSDTVINANSFKDKFSWLYLLKYEDGDEQIETIGDLPDLQHIDAVNISQEVLPTFKNLPKIDHISFTKNPLTFIKAEAFGSIPVNELFLYRNQITAIESKAFGTNLHVLYLSCNKLKKFSPRWFQNASSLEELDMLGNEITALPANVFKNFINLQQIILSFNKIATIGPGAFANRDNFWTLYLANNLLLELPANAFKAGSIKISSIHLQNNKLTFLSQEFLDKTNDTKARIYGNPWQCACWDIIRQWNTWVNYDLNKEPEGAPRCVAPLSFQTSCVPIVDQELIEYYEKNSAEKETATHYCASYL